MSSLVMSQPQATKTVLDNSIAHFNALGNNTPLSILERQANDTNTRYQALLKVAGNADKIALEQKYAPQLQAMGDKIATMRAAAQPAPAAASEPKPSNPLATPAPVRRTPSTVNSKPKLTEHERVLFDLETWPLNTDKKTFIPKLISFETVLRKIPGSEQLLARCAILRQNWKLVAAQTTPAPVRSAAPTVDVDAEVAEIKAAISAGIATLKTNQDQEAFKRVLLDNWARFASIAHDPSDKIEKLRSTFNSMAGRVGMALPVQQPKPAPAINIDETVATLHDTLRQAFAQFRANQDMPALTSTFHHVYQRFQSELKPHMTNPLVSNLNRELEAMAARFAANIGAQEEPQPILPSVTQEMAAIDTFLNDMDKALANPQTTEQHFEDWYKQVEARIKALDNSPNSKPNTTTLWTKLGAVAIKIEKQFAPLSQQPEADPDPELALLQARLAALTAPFVPASRPSGLKIDVKIPAEFSPKASRPVQATNTFELRGFRLNYGRYIELDRNQYRTADGTLLEGQDAQCCGATSAFALAEMLAAPTTQALTSQNLTAALNRGQAVYTAIKAQEKFSENRQNSIFTLHELDNATFGLANAKEPRMTIKLQAKTNPQRDIAPWRNALLELQASHRALPVGCQFVTGTESYALAILRSGEVVYTDTHGNADTYKALHQEPPADGTPGFALSFNSIDDAAKYLTLLYPANSGEFEAFIRVPAAAPSRAYAATAPSGSNPRVPLVAPQDLSSASVADGRSFKSIDRSQLPPKDADPQ